MFSMPGQEHDMHEKGRYEFDEPDELLSIKHQLIVPLSAVGNGRFNMEMHQILFGHLKAPALKKRLF